MATETQKTAAETMAAGKTDIVGADGHRQKVATVNQLYRLTKETDQWTKDQLRRWESIGIAMGGGLPDPPEGGFNFFNLTTIKDKMGLYQQMTGEALKPSKSGVTGATMSRLLAEGLVEVINYERMVAVNASGVSSSGTQYAATAAAGQDYSITAQFAAVAQRKKRVFGDDDE